MAKPGKQYKQRELKRYPYYMGIWIVGSVSVVGQILLLLDCFYPLLHYEVDAVSSVMSTCSEVVAGMYGITLTGYIFFADRFQNTSKEDESLYDSVQALLIRYNHMAGLISLTCLVCIVLGESLVLYGSNTILPQWAYRLVVNETLLLFFVTCNFILYFVISVLDPQKVDRISSQKKKKLSESGEMGDVQQFLADYEAIEDLLVLSFDEMVRSVRFLPGAPKGKPQSVHMLETLRNYGRISHAYWRKLEKLRQYRNLTLHDPSMTVSREMCDLAREVRTELEAKQKK